MKKKEIINRLIQADIMYHKLINTLHENQPVSSEFDIELLTIVARFQGAISV